jgi:hypothetical protein
MKRLGIGHIMIIMCAEGVFGMVKPRGSFAFAAMLVPLNLIYLAN